MEKRIEEFRRRSLGLFVHYGAYVQYKHGEWALELCKIDPAVYEKRRWPAITAALTQTTSSARPRRAERGMSPSPPATTTAFPSTTPAACPITTSCIPRTAATS